MEIMQGTLDLLVLRVLAAGPGHGWGIAQRVESVSGSLRMNQGSLYPALHKLEDAGLIDGEWQIAEETRRRVKVYRLTKAGRAHLRQEQVQWRAYVAAMQLVLEGA
jgi:PadR family transcriptional regulator, regulatory protein PadR